MEKGKIYEIVWDNGCFGCSSNICVKNLISKNVFGKLTQSYENCKENEKQSNINKQNLNIKAVELTK